MDVVARHLAAIDRLRARDLPAGGAGHLTVELDGGGGPGAGARTRAWTAADLHACRAAIAARLDDRWGGGPSWGQLTLRVRLARGEPLPEPWATLCLRTDALDVWQVPDGGPWLAVGVADRDEADGIRLLATVTATPPP